MPEAASDTTSQYLADLVLEHTVEGDRRNVVEVATHLILAGTADVAYSKALRLGQQAGHEYVNTDGWLVRIRFHGLKGLDVLHEGIEDGAELFYSRQLDVPTEQIRGMVADRNALEVFLEATGRMSENYPNLMPGSVMRHLEGLGFDRSSPEGPA